MADQARIVADVKDWIESFVIAHNLCPFAAQPLRLGRVRFELTTAESEHDLLLCLANELGRLAHDPNIETTLIIHPLALTDFEAYNQFLDLVDALLEQQDLAGVFQVASFHPDYQFAGTEAEAPENKTNQSPYPMLHILREESVEQAIAQGTLLFDEGFGRFTRCGHIFEQIEGVLLGLAIGNSEDTERDDGGGGC